MPWVKREHQEFVPPAVRTCGNCGQVIPDDHPGILCDRCAGVTSQPISTAGPAPESATPAEAPTETANVEEPSGEQPPADTVTQPGEPTQPA